MNIKLKLAVAIYIANIVVMTVIGLLFELRTEFMPFHSDVIQTTWANVEPQAQILYLGMMRTEGAGFLASATALAIFLWASFKQQAKWPYLAMTLVGIVEYAPSLAANIYVALITPANPPWLLMSTLSCSLILALILAIKALPSGNTEQIAAN